MAIECRDGTYHRLGMTSFTVLLRRTVEAWSHRAGAQALYDRVIFHITFEFRRKAKKKEIKKLFVSLFKGEQSREGEQSIAPPSPRVTKNDRFQTKYF